MGILLHMVIISRLDDGGGKDGKVEERLLKDLRLASPQVKMLNILADCGIFLQSPDIQGT